MAEGNLKDDLIVNRDMYNFKLIEVPADFEGSKQILVSHVKAIINANERHHGECERFYIGKTYLRLRKRRTFIPDRPQTTCKMKGIIDRWRARKKVGYHCMAVIAVLHDENIPENYLRRSNSKQQYALSLEGSLISHFMYEEPDRRLENETTQQGGLEKKRAIAYVLYLAMKFVEAPSESDQLKQAQVRHTTSDSPTLRECGSLTSEDDSESRSSGDSTESLEDLPSGVSVCKESSAPPTGSPASEVNPELGNCTQQRQCSLPNVRTGASELATELATTDASNQLTAITSAPTPTDSPTHISVTQPLGTPTGASNSTRETWWLHTPLAQSTTPISGPRPCRCGSTSHRNTKHHLCPLNPKNSDPKQQQITKFFHPQ